MCRKASPEPSDNSTKPNPFSGLNHLTVASISGPDCDCWKEDGPRPMSGIERGGSLRVQLLGWCSGGAIVNRLQVRDERLISAGPNTARQRQAPTVHALGQGL